MGADATFEQELESLLDRQRASMTRLVGTMFGALVVGVFAGFWLLANLGPIGAVVLALAFVVAFVLVSVALAEHRAASEAVARRVARR
jgi:hypothetical protein